MPTPTTLVAEVSAVQRGWSGLRTAPPAPGAHLREADAALDLMSFYTLFVGTPFSSSLKSPQAPSQLPAHNTLIYSDSPGSQRGSVLPPTLQVTN